MTLRTDRVGEAIREVLAEELATLTDPGLGFVSITGVRVTPDLRGAIVYFSVLHPESDAESTARALDRARRRLQAAIGRKLRLKRTPVLRFEFDAGIAEGEHMDAVLRRLFGDDATET